MMRTFLAFLALCALGIQPASAQAGKLIVDEPGFTARSRVDWTGGMLEVEASRQLDPSTAALPRAKADAETDIESRLSGFMTAALSAVIIDSSHTYGDLLGRDPALFSRVSELAGGAQRQALFLSDDFSHLIARYSLPLFGAQGIASPCTRHGASPCAAAWDGSPPGLSPDFSSTRRECFPSSGPTAWPQRGRPCSRASSMKA